MDLKDIIQSDSDRLFIVDRECRIIFTGESEDDDKPFIRIGNWIDMPVELIPLVENIIITDSIAGNPSHEQFNIAITNLSSNRYIGSENIVSRYQNFETLFGLDLENASIVNIEKDIPELSREKNISGKNQFIGVFYRNGNFKTQKNRKEIFDLLDEESKSIDSVKLNQRLQETARGDRYRGNGIVVIDHNPLFYRRNTFTSYLFPYNYFNDFYELDIRPGSVKRIIFPSGNYINLTPFFKWLHCEQKNIMICSDRTGDLKIINNLYRKINITNESFSGLSIMEGEKEIINNIEGTYNLCLKYPMPETEDLKIAYIKAKNGTEEIIKDDYDAVFVQYSVYEDTNLLFKSTSTPVAVIDDGNPNISRIPSMENLIIRPGIQYEFQKTASHEKAVGFSGCSRDLHDALKRGNREQILEAINTELASEEDELRQKKSLFNINSLLRLHIFTTTDRQFSKQLRDIWQLITAKSDMDFIFGMRSHVRVILLFHNRAIFQFIDEISELTVRPREGFYFDKNHTLQKDPVPGESSTFEQRVDLDRRRLRMLLDLLIEKENPGIRHDKIAELDEAITGRKKEYSDGSSISFFKNRITGTSQGDEEAVDLFNSQDDKTKKGISQAGAGSRLLKAAGFMKKNESKGNRPGRSSLTGETSRSDNSPESGSASGPYDSSVFQKTSGTGDSSTSQKTSGSDNSGIKKIVIPASILLAAILAVLFLLTSDFSLQNNTSDSTDTAGKGQETYIRDWECKEEERTILDRYSIKISDHDIYVYANRVALKNGYKELSFNKFREMNPHWIYPSNVFIMMDDEKIVVRKGDTLWGLSEKKLTRMSIKFYTILEKIKDSTSPDPKDIASLKNYSFSDNHRNIIKGLKKKHETDKR